LFLPPTSEDVCPRVCAGIAGLLGSHAGKRPDGNLWLAGTLHSSLVLPGVVAILLQPLRNITAPNEPSAPDFEGREFPRLEKFVESSSPESQPEAHLLNGEQLLVLRDFCPQFRSEPPLFAQARC
jgi:hypothetical protein